MILYSKESSDHLPEVTKYLYGARTAHCGVRDLFLKSSQAIFCRIRYSSSVNHLLQFQDILEDLHLASTFMYTYVGCTNVLTEPFFHG